MKKISILFRMGFPPVDFLGGFFGDGVEWMAMDRLF